MSTDHDCTCGDCATADLPVTPFELLRARQGMLLGEDDFRVLMGNPRGKQMLHNAWLHGAGVVWGYDVCRDGLLGLVVRPGLALDGWGRELALAATATVDLRHWLTDHDQPKNQDECHARTVTACLVAEFDCATARPVPTLADPCDVTRTHDSASRIVEGVRIALAPGECRPCRPHLSVEERDDEDDCDPDDGVSELCRRLRRLATGYVTHRAPACHEGTDVPTLFPVPEEEAPVVLACVQIDVLDADGCTTVQDVRVDDCCRCVLLPDQVLGELLCAIAADLVETDHDHRPKRDRHHDRHRHGDRDAWWEGPRVEADDVVWDEDERCFLVPVSAELVAGSVRRAITVTSLSARGWVEEDVESITYEGDGEPIVVRLAGRPMNSVVRLVVKGTGPTPVYGVDPAAPLAGIVGGPRGSRHDGHDAVITVFDDVREREGS
ncbi:MAG TPA: hypothetical protein VES03_04490 [Motilibacterales bacterium]|nr:hypothetical protein [Motilibacterales bacterium]